MQARMGNPAMVVPGAMKALLGLSDAAKKTGLPKEFLELLYLRASQINGCGVCVDMHSRALRKAGEPDERLFAVAAWRDTPYYTDAERAALALTEAVTGIDVPDDVWDEAARHYDEQKIAGLVIAISVINVWNRLNIATAQVATA